MKSFIWRMRSNLPYFLASVVLFTILFVTIAFKSIAFYPDGSVAKCLDKTDPILFSYCACFVFFFIFTKRYAYDEDYFYGRSRVSAFLSSLCAALVFAFLFACYGMGVALLVRRAILKNPEFAVSSNIYRLSSAEMFFNFALLFSTNISAYETANIARKFRSWKFWINLAVCVTSAIILIVFFVIVPMGKNHNSFNYWQAAFSVLIPQIVIMAGGDLLMSRGKQYR